MKQHNQSFKMNQGIPKPVLRQITKTVSISSHIYEVIREGILVGLTNEYISKHLGIHNNLIYLCRQHLTSAGLIAPRSYGSRTNTYKPVTLYTTNHVGEQIAIPNFYSKFWNIGPDSPQADPLTFKLPIPCADDFLTYGRSTDKYIKLPTTEAITAIVTELPVKPTQDDLQELIVPVNGPIDVKKDFIVRENQEHLVDKKFYVPAAFVPREEIDLFVPTQTKKPLTIEPVSVTIRGIKFVLHVKTTEVIITDNSIEIK